MIISVKCKEKSVKMLCYSDPNILGHFSGTLTLHFTLYTN